jgi:tetratricopeptide (TPR) repeat protein/transglutaminase-like putative cysteine protease
LPVPALAGDVPLFQPVPDWVIDAGAITATEAKTDGLILLDRQQKVEQDRTWTYSDLAFRATASEQLAGLGNVTLNWHPDKGDLIIHRLEIIRGDQIIDVTKGSNKFTVLRREQNLEKQWISGILSATMQIEGLKVGDILRMASSISFADPALGGNVEFSLPLIVEPAKVGRSALRMIWPQDRTLKWRVTTKDTPSTLTKRGKYNELLIAQPLAKLPDYPGSAPLRFAPPVIFEASSFATWEAVSKSTAPLYATEGLIPAGSSLAERVSKIAASSTDPKVRAAAALRMVQDDIRYLFSGQTQGNYVPQKPMETWEKRYGDCKAKTMLLTSILRSLGIEAEPALVSSQMGDLLPSRLPALGAFDHVLVRAVIDGKIYWLDGTLLGTRLADLSDAPTFGYALPIRPAGSALEKIIYTAPARALVSVDKDVDATAGIALPKPYKLILTFRNGNVAYFRQAQANLETKKLDETIDQTIQQWFPDSVIASRALTFDDEAATVRIVAEGITNVAWDQVDDRRVLSPGNIMSDFDLSVDRSRPAWKDVPVTTSYPNAFEFRYRLHLPNKGSGFTLENPKAISGRFGGYDMATATKLEAGIFELNESWKTSELEIPSAVVPAERERIARAKGEPIRVVAPADYAPRWRETREARGAGLLKRLDALYAADIAQDPADVTGYVNRARYLEGIDDKAGAIADLTKILAIQPDAATYLWRAGLNKNLDQKKALADVEAARAIDPASASVTATQVEIFLKQKRYDEAVAAIDAALPLQTNRTGLLVLKAEVLARAGKSAEALEVINKANADKPGNPDLLNGRCWVRALANVELDAALKDCTKAIELSEYPAGMLDSRGLVYFRLQRYDDALADLDAALRLSPGMSPTLYVRGVVQSWKGVPSASERDLKDARTIQPDVAEQYIRIGVKPKG